MPRPGWDARFAGLVGPGSGDLVGATGIAAQMVGCWGGGPTLLASRPAPAGELADPGQAG
jgi:hypothetical protein